MPPGNFDYYMCDGRNELVNCRFGKPGMKGYNADRKMADLFRQITNTPTLLRLANTNVQQG